MPEKTFAIWGGRFRDTATAWNPDASPADILDIFHLAGPFSLEEADQACLEGIRRNVDVCAHRMRVAELGATSYGEWAQEMRRQHEAALARTSSNA